ncbi:NAD-dependent epimerase/dehydratase family protein [Sulfitobacter porphyrae]|uniref:NAD-dependent epimerase/dehydratase family protein n=1 Tax=Sulfitobacter porphyrae TaxID=1246864 RepID=A0ABW2B3A5_9RHOB|nr:TDP-glucose-4,6-dehydratase [Sulfitobacter porphyrae]
MASPGDAESGSQVNRILITGAAGRIGRTLRKGLKRHDRILRLVDQLDLGPPDAAEEIVHCNLRDPAAGSVFDEVHTLIHLAAVPDERPWNEIFPLNYELTQNVFEAARVAGVRRIIFASSIQAVGFHPISVMLDGNARIRPSGNYGLSKAFGEALGSLYADRHGMSFIALRIASFEPQPTDKRMLKTWLSPRDAVHLFDRAIDATDVHYLMAYGVSANTSGMADNAHADLLGYHPLDNAEIHADHIADAGAMLGPNASVTHGGAASDAECTDTGQNFLKHP